MLLARLAVLALASATLWGQEKLTLEQAVGIALKNNPRLSADRLTAEVAGEFTKELRAAYFPTIVANTTAAGASNESRLAAGALNNPIIFNRYAAGTSISQLITDFGRTSSLVQSSRHRAESQQEGVRALQAQLILAVHRSYFAVLRSAGVQAVAEETERARQVAVEQVTALARSNLKSTLDVSFAEVNLSEARLTVLTARNERMQAMAELSTVLGYARPQSWDLEDVPGADDAPPEAAGLIGEALQIRPEAAALRSERDAAASFALAEKKLAMPTVSALANAGVAPIHDDRLKNRYAAAGINLSMPVFNGGLFSARQREADLRVEAAAQRIREMENQIAREVTLAVLAAEAGFERIKLTAQLLQQAKLAAELAQERYNLGLSSIVELSQAQLNETAARMRAAAAKYDYLLQRSIIAFQTGRLR